MSTPRILVLALLATSLALPAPAQKKGSGKQHEPPPPAGTSKSFAALGLTVTIPDAFTELAEKKAPNGQVQQRWLAKLGSVALSIDLYALPLAQFGFEEPEDVMDLLLENARDERSGDPSFAFEEQALVGGPLGVGGFASLAWGGWHGREGTQVVGTCFYLGGVLPEHGYCVQVFAEPEPGPEGKQAIADFLRRGVRYTGVLRDPRWTDQEAKARWDADVPGKLAGKCEKVIRTAHYVVFTNSSGGKQFAEQMELNYAEIRKVFPFEDLPGRRLMPVFLFQNPAEYHAFFAKQFKTGVEEAEKSKGVAHADWYATWFEASNDPVHIHEGTHQIFRNRLRLPGGGSWFQEGVAEYMSSKPNDRNVAATSVRKGRHTPLADFVAIKSLLFSAKPDVKGGDTASSHYDLAAYLIEFLRESKFGRGRFQEFVHAVGRAPRGHVAAIERAVQSVYGVDLAGLEKEWIAYSKQR